jgi:hypothetical protein
MLITSKIKNMKNLILYSLLAGIMLISACDPNKELYEDLDTMKVPYNKSIEYTLTDADYNAIGGEVRTLNAFTEEEPAMNHVPTILKRNFLALNLGSSAMVTYNYMVAHPTWYDAGFGYELQAEDYQQLGLIDAFSATYPAEDNLPVFLIRKYPNATEGQSEKLIYNFREGSLVHKNIDTYVFDGSNWVLENRRENIPFVGYELTPDDYAVFGGSIAQNNNFSDVYPADVYLPVWLKNKYPYAIEGAEKVLKYKVFAGGSVSDEIAHYLFDGIAWQRSKYIISKSEQYVYGELGWAFDPTTRFIMVQSDYMHLAVIDPIPHAVFNDFGYYFGASAFYVNFDMRLEARRVQKNAEGNYIDAALGEIFENEGREATVAEMFRRIVEEGLIDVLQNRYPDAQPQVGGIDVHYIVGFETFNDNFSRSYLEAEYQCIASGDPPQFELIEGPRERQ